MTRGCAARTEGGSGGRCFEAAGGQRLGAPDSPPSAPRPPLPARPFGASRRRLRGSKPNSCRPGALRDRAGGGLRLLGRPRSQPGAFEGGGKPRVCFGGWLPLPVKRRRGGPCAAVGARNGDFPRGPDPAGRCPCGRPWSARQCGPHTPSPAAWAGWSLPGWAAPGPWLRAAVT